MAAVAVAARNIRKQRAKKELELQQQDAISKAGSEPGGDSPQKFKFPVLSKVNTFFND